MSHDVEAPAGVPGSVAVVGGGVAGFAVVRELRRRGFAGGIALVDPQGVPYDRPPLSKEFLTGDADAHRLLLVLLNAGLAAELGLDAEWLATDDGVRFLTGEQPGPDARPVAQAYAGHQFGHYSPRLGDGRALLLGELTAPDGRLHDLHLKGSGRTPFARGNADGQAVLGPMLREYVVSEAMHALGVPTTRALAVVATGHPVRRETVLPGAVLARTAASHLRVGTAQYAAALPERADPTEVLRRIVDEAIARHHPHATDAEHPALALYEAVIAAQAELVSRWMLVGFVHGVMNTDNMTLSGETIDYGPCAFIDAFDPAASFSSIDTQGRYAYGNQGPIAAWNLARLGEALVPVLDDDPDRAVSSPRRRARPSPRRGE